MGAAAVMEAAECAARSAERARKLRRMAESVVPAGQRRSKILHLLLLGELRGVRQPLATAVERQGRRRFGALWAVEDELGRPLAQKTFYIHTAHHSNRSRRLSV